MIIRAEKSHNYSIVSNCGLEDKNLTLRAKGLYAFLLTKPDNWTITSRGLESQLKESRNTILKVLQELEDVGYVKREKKRTEKGTFEYETILYEGSVVKNVPTVAQKTVAGKTVAGSLSRIVNTEIVNTDKDSTNVLERYGRSDINQLIEHFENYLGTSLPRKQKQRFAANTLLKRHSLEELIGVANFIFTANSEDRFSPRVSTVEDLRDKLPAIVTYRKSQLAGDSTKKRKVHKL